MSSMIIIGIIFKLVKCFAKAFNYLEGKDKVDTKFEEVSELFF